jgi:hypothetical protein
LTSLAKELDATVEENKKLNAVVLLIGEDKDELDETGKKIGEKFKNVAFAVPVEYESGPKNYGVNPDAGTTVLIYSGGTVLVNHAIAPGKLDEKKAKEIAKDSLKALKK